MAKERNDSSALAKTLSDANITIINALKALKEGDDSITLANIPGDAVSRLGNNIACDEGCGSLTENPDYPILKAKRVQELFAASLKGNFKLEEFLAPRGDVAFAGNNVACDEGCK